MNETIGQVIRRLRRERNFTQEELAEQLGVTAQAVSKWESEIGLPDISQVVPLATVFGVPTDVLFGRFGVNDDEEVERIITEISEKQVIIQTLKSYTPSTSENSTFTPMR